MAEACNKEFVGLFPKTYILHLPERKTESGDEARLHVDRPAYFRLLAVVGVFGLYSDGVGNKALVAVRVASMRCGLHLANNTLLLIE